MTTKLLTTTLTVVGIGTVAVATALATPDNIRAQFSITPQSQQEAALPQAPTEEISLTAIPPRVGDDGSLLVKPGERTQETIRIKNTGTKTVQINSQAIDFIIDVDGETPIPIMEETSSRWSLASWLVLTPNFQTLAPNETGFITVIIDVPADALPGGHYAMVMSQPSAAGSVQLQEGSSAARIEQNVGTLMYVVVDGPINEEAFIRNLTFPDFTEYGPVPFSFSIDNQSDVHISPKINVEIFSLIGRKVATIPVEGKNIFPLSSRNFEGEWDQIWGWGRYTARATMTFGTQGSIVIAETSFWLLPIKLIIAAIIVLLALIVFYIVIKRHIHHRRDASQTHIKNLEDKIRQMEQEKLDKYQ